MIKRKKTEIFSYLRASTSNASNMFYENACIHHVFESSPESELSLFPATACPCHLSNHGKPESSSSQIIHLDSDVSRLCKIFWKFCANNSDVIMLCKISKRSLQMRNLLLHNVVHIKSDKPANEKASREVQLVADILSIKWWKFQ